MPDPSTGSGSPRAQSRGDWSQDLRSRLADLRLDGAREGEIVEELSQHLDDRYEELCADGVPPADARRMALGELNEAGGLAPRLRSLAQARMPAPLPVEPKRGLFRGTWLDLRHALRTFRQQPGFAALVIITLSLGIAVNTIVFTIVNAAVLRPLPFDDPDRLVRLSAAIVVEGREQMMNLSYPDLQDWQQAHRTFEHIAALAERRVDLSGDERPPARIEMAFASWNLFDLLRQPPALGRVFTREDDRPGAPPVVIIGADLWQSRYGGDRSVLGRTVRIDGVPATVVGIMPPGFGFPDRMNLWLPVTALPEALVSRSDRVLNAVGRLRPGATIDQARAELAAITAALAERHPETNRGVNARVTPAAIAGDIIGVLIALLGAVGFVLLIACANVANLLLARAGDRSRDLSLRVALGASRWRIVRQLLAESLLLAAAGGLAGLALSHTGLQLFLARVGPEAAPPSWVQFTLDRTVFAYLAALCMGSALVCGLVPAWHASRSDLAAAINDAGRRDTGSRFRRRWTGAFVVAQVTLALVLLTGAALMASNIVETQRIDVGVETGELFQTAFSLRRSEYTPDRRLEFVRRLEERFAAARGVDAAVVSNPPMGGSLVRRMQAEGQPGSDMNALPVVSVVDVGAKYFEVLRAPVIAGRVLDAGDARQPGEYVVVNEQFARLYFDDGRAVGRGIRLLPPNPGPDDTSATLVTVVGVIANIRQRMLPSREFDPVVYRSYGEDRPQVVQILARSASGPGAALTFLREQVQALDADLPLFPLVTVEEGLAQQFWPQRVFGSLFGVFALIAVLLATCGLYGVTSYAVSRRIREIGIRVALGADARRVWWAVTGSTLRQLAIGLVLGTAGAAALTRVLPALLFGTSAVDPLVFGGVIAVLMAVGVGASAIPAWKALRVDAVEALRAE